MHARAFGRRRLSSALCTLTIVCEVIEGAGPHQPPGNRSRDGKAERPDSNRLNGDPKDLIRAMPAKGDHLAGRYFDRAAIGHGPGSPGGERGTGRLATTDRSYAGQVTMLRLDRQLRGRGTVPARSSRRTPIQQVTSPARGTGRGTARRESQCSQCCQCDSPCHRCSYCAEWMRPCLW